MFGVVWGVFVCFLVCGFFGLFFWFGCFGFFLLGVVAFCFCFAFFVWLGFFGCGVVGVFFKISFVGSWLKNVLKNSSSIYLILKSHLKLGIVYLLSGN